MDNKKLPYRLIDVEERAKLYSATFAIPVRSLREGLWPGNLVKLDFDNRERMWVKISGQYATKNYFGILISSPLHLGLRHGDPIEFGPEHIMEIWNK